MFFLSEHLDSKIANPGRWVQRFSNFKKAFLKLSQIIESKGYTDLDEVE
jgi:hypothetical protein